MSNTPRISSLAALAALLTCQAGAAREPVLGVGERVEARWDGDLDGDGEADIAYIARDQDGRELVVALSRGLTESLELDPDPLGSGELSAPRGVLLLKDLTGGTTAVSSTRRWRYDARTRRMRLIGLDATLYSRTYAHAGFEASWNLLTGDVITRELRLNSAGGERAYNPAIEKRSKRRSPSLYLPQSADPDALVGWGED